MTWQLPPIWVLVLWIAWGAQALLTMLAVRKFNRLIRTQRGRYDDITRDRQPHVAVIVPVKGVGEHFDAHVRSVLGQRYRSYRVIFAVESQSDPAHAALEQHVASPPVDPLVGLTAAEVVVAGRAEREGQKVHNQLAALRRLADEEQFVAFADADAVVGPLWLQELAAPPNWGDIGATTGYRWLIPPAEAGESLRAARRHLPSLLASVINASGLTLMGSERSDCAWGGSMAIRRDILEQYDLAGRWRGSMNDDWQLTRLVRRVPGYRILFMTPCVVPTDVNYTWSSAWEFGTRQYRQTRLYSPKAWSFAAAVLTAYWAGWVAAIGGLAAGYACAVAPILWVLIMERWRARQRRRVIERLFDAALIERLRPVLTLERWATPLYMAVHLALVWSTALGRRITWSGITYHIRDRQDVEIVDR